MRVIGHQPVHPQGANLIDCHDRVVPVCAPAALLLDVPRRIRQDGAVSPGRLIIRRVLDYPFAIAHASAPLRVMANHSATVTRRPCAREGGGWQLRGTLDGMTDCTLH